MATSESAETDALCAGSQRASVSFNYNARGRAMHTVTCGECGREFRKQGRTTGTSGVPSHHSTPPGGTRA